MADPLLDPLLERIARSQQAGMRLGSVTVIDATDASLTLSLAGDVITGVRWIGSYTPVVADVVVVSRVGAMWVCLGKLSKQLSVAPTTLYPTAPVVRPTTTWQGSLSTSLPVWQWSLSVADDFNTQGKWDGFGFDPTQYAGVWYVPGISTALPVGATVTAAKLRLHRWPGFYPESTLVTPRLRMHAYTTIPSGAPTWTGSAWAPGALAAGQTGVWDLPSTWLTALLAGTAKGVGVDSAAFADYTTFSNLQIELSYSVPA